MTFFHINTPRLSAFAGMPLVEHSMPCTVGNLFFIREYCMIDSLPPFPVYLMILFQTGKALKNNGYYNWTSSHQIAPQSDLGLPTAFP